MIFVGTGDGICCFLVLLGKAFILFYTPKETALSMMLHVRPKDLKNTRNSGRISSTHFTHDRDFRGLWARPNPRVAWHVSPTGRPGTCWHRWTSKFR